MVGRLVARVEISDTAWARKQGKAAVRATADAINRAARRGLTFTIRELAPELGVKQKAIRAGTRVVRATTSKLSASIEARGRPLNLSRFQAKQTSRGVRAKPWGRVHVFPHTFTAFAGRTVFVRSQSRGGKLRGVWGPGIAKEFVEKFETPEVRRFIEQVFIKEFRRRYELLSAKAAAPARRR